MSSSAFTNQSRREGHILVQRLPKNEKYATTLPVSKEKAALVRFYCMVHQLPIYEFVDRLLESELAEFKVKLEALKKLKTT